MTTTSTVHDYVHSKPADEETYVQAEEILQIAVDKYPGPDPSVGLNDQGVKLYPVDFLKVATMIAVLAVSANLQEQANAASSNPADAFRVV